MTSLTSHVIEIHSSAGAGGSVSAFRFYEVPGGHSSMLQEPHVRILAEQLQYSIDEALADRPIHAARADLTTNNHPHINAQNV